MKPTTNNWSPLRMGLAVLALLFGPCARAADKSAPIIVEAGQAFSIPLEGSGQTTFYLIGPDHILKGTVNLPGELQIQSSDVRAAGRYQIILCGRSCTSTTFAVKAAQPAHLSFFLHPSRVPVSSRDSIGAVAFVFDQYFNLVLSPATVDLQIGSAKGESTLRRIPSRDGVAWMQTGSTSREGPTYVTATLGHIKAVRVAQQVAGEACRLRMKAATSGNMVAIETDPVRDCNGNPLADGTIVSFTKVDKAGKSTVDVPIKKSVARVQFKVAGPARISVACGIVLGNDLVLNGRL